MCLLWCKKVQQVTLVFCCPLENKRDILNVSCPLPQRFFLKGSCGFSRGLPPPPQMNSLLSVLKSRSNCARLKLCYSHQWLKTSYTVLWCWWIGACIVPGWRPGPACPRRWGIVVWGCFSLATSSGGAWMMSLEQTCNLWKWLKVMERIHPVRWPHCNFGGLGRLKLIIGIVLAQAVAALGID